ncbi:hypothetical protein BDQ94DRAFT_140165 [Aspergillus welwitschiae]|uniref:Uncharacterized protein n=1 Tax=Aspergillus welwitschiae TaxID=1341132 RepID=A0A3F3Q7A5_9EURO|nr:hypothetical protein BDQ94DRAFT_140165 [Aspergillus welwitschiae]RDH35058.1 hypothetical protein BDQ94DRAFT_140165 [Aspergillus welwitschiae]
MPFNFRRISRALAVYRCRSAPSAKRQSRPIHPIPRPAGVLRRLIARSLSVGHQTYSSPSFTLPPLPMLQSTWLGYYLLSWVKNNGPRA